MGITACGSADWKICTVCWRQDQRKTEHRHSTLAIKSHHGQAICQLFEMKRLFLFIGNLAACIVENVSTLFYYSFCNRLERVLLETKVIYKSANRGVATRDYEFFPVLYFLMFCVA